MGFIDKKKKRKSGFRSEGAGKKSYSSGEYQNSANRMRSKVECTSCGKICEVPFKPIAGKPVYCNDCFGKKNSDFTEEKSSRFNRESGSNRRSNSDLDQINAKLDRILKLLEE